MLGIRPLPRAVSTLDKSFQLARHLLDLPSEVRQLASDVLYVFAGCHFAGFYAAMEEELSVLRNVQTTDSVCRAAIAALHELSERIDGYHRVSPPDALIAAVAQEAAIGVLHYDQHYDRLAEVLNFESRWVADPDTLD